ncbi:arsenate reductase ArsC [Methylophaga lonarensis]|uniref:arsenate reductase ArsC n=1 Tax=Methylophaga lonarensis TaxID=999151 RepID=UPI003D2BA707
MKLEPVRLLFLCTHNACRSQLAEALTRHLAGPEIEVASTGSQPSRELHPLTLKILSERQIDHSNLYSKSWDQLSDFDPDIVITVCDQAAGESCPVWFGKAIKAHWGLPDPSRIDDAEQQNKIVSHVMKTLDNRISRLLASNITTLDKQALSELLHQLEKC